MPSTRFWKYCPVCLTSRVYRPEVKTCGSKLCINSWRSFSIEQRGIAIEKADELHDAALHVEQEGRDFNRALGGDLTALNEKIMTGDMRILSPEELAKITGTQSPLPTPEKEVMTDEDFLSKHVPGYLEKDKKS